MKLSHFCKCFKQNNHAFETNFNEIITLHYTVTRCLHRLYLILKSFINCGILEIINERNKKSNMDITTKSIKDNLEVQLNKSIKNISKEELLKIKNITINRIGFGGQIQEIDYNDVLFFNNLEELNIFNCMIDKLLMVNILKLKKLKILKIYNSDFVDFIDDTFSNLNLEELTISNCLGMKGVMLKNLKYLDLKNINIDFVIKDVNTLNISNTDANINALNLINVKKIIISEKSYNRVRNLNNLDSDIVVINDRMEVMKEIKNG